MQLPLAQMANRDGEAGMETMLWDINVIPNEQDNGYLMLPPGVLHMSALGRFGRFTLFSPRVSHSKHLPCSFCFVLCFGFGVFVTLLCFCFLFCKCFGIPNSPRSLDFFWLVAAWVKSRAERPSVSVVNRQLHVQIGCKLGIRNRKDELEASKAKQITN